MHLHFLNVVAQILFAAKTSTRVHKLQHETLTPQDVSLLDPKNQILQHLANVVEREIDKRRLYSLPMVILCGSALVDVIRSRAIELISPKQRLDIINGFSVS